MQAGVGPVRRMLRESPNLGNWDLMQGREMAARFNQEQGVSLRLHTSVQRLHTVTVVDGAEQSAGGMGAPDSQHPRRRPSVLHLSAKALAPAQGHCPIRLPRGCA